MRKNLTHWHSSSRWCHWAIWTSPKSRKLASTRPWCHRGHRGWAQHAPQTPCIRSHNSLKEKLFLRYQILRRAPPRKLWGLGPKLSSWETTQTRLFGSAKLTHHQQQFSSCLLNTKIRKCGLCCQSKKPTCFHRSRVMATRKIREFPINARRRAGLKHSKIEMVGSVQIVISTFGGWTIEKIFRFLSWIVSVRVSGPRPVTWGAGQKAQHKTTYGRKF